MSDVIGWLLEPDHAGVRYLAMRDLLALPEDDRELATARETAHRSGPIAEILAEMEPDGYWVEPGPGYMGKYRSTVWSVIALGQLGARAIDDERIERACDYVLGHSLVGHGLFTMTGAPSGTLDCLQGNLCEALMELGLSHPRLDPSRADWLGPAFDWLARTATGDGIAPATDRSARVRYYAGKCGPGFACGANDRQPCAWGAVKVAMALAKLPQNRVTPVVETARETAVEFLLGTDPATAEYPRGYAPRPSRNWWKFGFPVFYVTDLLQNAEALARLGHAADPRLSRALEVILEKRDADGRWALEYDYAGKTWGDYGERKKPSKWVTLRAMRTLSLVGDS